MGISIALLHYFSSDIGRENTHCYYNGNDDVVENGCDDGRGGGGGDAAAAAGGDDADDGGGGDDNDNGGGSGGEVLWYTSRGTHTSCSMNVQGNDTTHLIWQYPAFGRYLPRSRTLKIVFK